MADTWRVEGALETVEVPAAADAASVCRHASAVLERWKAGEAPDTRAVLSRHPQLLREKSILLRLACEEFWQRIAAGEAVHYQEYARDFPAYQSSLERALYSQHVTEETSHLERLQERQPPPAWPAVGEEFLGFPLLQELGSGAFANVYLATEPLLSHRLVALKVSLQGMQEAERLGKLQHPNIVPIYRVEQDPDSGLTAVCMPYLGRATLCDVLDQAFRRRDKNAEPAGRPRRPPPLPSQARTILAAAQTYESIDPDSGVADPWLASGTYIDGVLRLGEQLASALHYTHQAGIYHLDLKPSNVLLTPSGRPMLLDFNLSLERTRRCCASAARCRTCLPSRSGPACWETARRP
jgi:hypothetical protein